MNVCIPVEEDKGLDSQVCPHFGSAPIFIVVDTETRSCRAITNANQHHGHGMCQPLAALAGEDLGAVVVGGIGLGALRKLRKANVEVFLSELSTVQQTIDAHAEGSLRRMTAELACGHHGKGPHGRGQESCHGTSTGYGTPSGPWGKPK